MPLLEIYNTMRVLGNAAALLESFWVFPARSKGLQKLGEGHGHDAQRMALLKHTTMLFKG